MKILCLDIETAPNLAYVWKLWDENVGLEQLVSSHYMLCWSAKWLGQKEIMFSSKFTFKTSEMLEQLHSLLDEADAVIHYNGKRFDIPHINREFITNGFKPPSPYKQIDLLETVKRQFRFPSNKLDYVSQALGLGKKEKHTGFSLWVGCIQDDPKAWKTMQKYNIQDVLLLEKLYKVVQPWIKGHANHSLFNPDALVCPNCGGKHHNKRGFAYTVSSVFQRYQCKGCGGWFKDNKPLNRNNFKTSSIQ